MDEQEQQYYEIEPEFTSDQLQDVCQVAKGVSFTSLCFWWMGLIASGSAFWCLLALGVAGGGLWTVKTLLEAANIDAIGLAKKMTSKNQEQGDDSADNL